MRLQARRVVAACAAVLMIAASAGCSQAAEPQGGASGEPIKVGAILSLSGTYAALGESEKNALELEVERINDAGGVSGRQIELLIEDDATDEAKAVAAAAKLIGQEGVVAILGASGTGQSMAARGEVQRAGIPQISMAGGTAITKEFDPLVFQTPWSNTIVVPRVLEAMKAAGITKVGLISDSGGYGKDGRDVILASVSTAGIELVADETFNAGDADMTAQLTRIKGSGAQAILMWTAGKEATTVVKGARDLGITLPIYGGSGQARTEFIEGAGQAAEGVVIATGRSFVPESWAGVSEEVLAEVQPFIDSYSATYGETPDIFAGHAYDALKILTTAIEGVGADADGEELRAAIESTQVSGYGGVFKFSATDHNGLSANDLALFTVRDGVWVIAE